MLREITELRRKVQTRNIYQIVSMSSGFPAIPSSKILKPSFMSAYKHLSRISCKEPTCKQIICVINIFRKPSIQQECVPVGCVPSATVAVCFWVGSLHPPPPQSRLPPDQAPPGSRPPPEQAPPRNRPPGPGTPRPGTPPCCKACWYTTCNACWDSTLPPPPPPL